ncbi:DUF397 domain-containing protein [Streptomyces sp. QHH-9511]|uniref:DUF397 domain-containing protein n=1 Tax=Streptomyces sp. QHH-9511 TaxID=2684468 RepID=UPI00131765F3|nr:DUF397 domain-containing protein [Streptomyces sp. QHH-9511]QGZ50284.1 DUF397 domain-containing protein [Streptomyces sp. QHH-9511]
MSTDLNWFKSSYSSEQGGACVEVAVARTTSSARPHSVHVRDSKDTARPSFAVSPAAWAAFVSVR